MGLRPAQGTRGGREMADWRPTTAKWGEGPTGRGHGPRIRFSLRALDEPFCFQSHNANSLIFALRLLIAFPITCAPCQTHRTRAPPPASPSPIPSALLPLDRPLASYHPPVRHARSCRTRSGWMRSTRWPRCLTRCTLTAVLSRTASASVRCVAGAVRLSSSSGCRLCTVAQQ
jgi:hypothetical protein